MSRSSKQTPPASPDTGANNCTGYIGMPPDGAQAYGYAQGGMNMAFTPQMLQYAFYTAGPDGTPIAFAPMPYPGGPMYQYYMPQTVATHQPQLTQATVSRTIAGVPQPGDQMTYLIAQHRDTFKEALNYACVPLGASVRGSYSQACVSERVMDETGKIKYVVAGDAYCSVRVQSCPANIQEGELIIIKNKSPLTSGAESPSPIHRSQHSGPFVPLQHSDSGSFSRSTGLQAILEVEDDAVNKDDEFARKPFIPLSRSNSQDVASFDKTFTTSSSSSTSGSASSSRPRSPFGDGVGPLPNYAIPVFSFQCRCPFNRVMRSACMVVIDAEESKVLLTRNVNTPSFIVFKRLLTGHLDGGKPQIPEISSSFSDAELNMLTHMDETTVREMYKPRHQFDSRWLARLENPATAAVFKAIETKAAEVKKSRQGGGADKQSPSLSPTPISSTQQWRLPTSDVKHNCTEGRLENALEAALRETFMTTGVAISPSSIVHEDSVEVMHPNSAVCYVTRCFTAVVHGIAKEDKGEIDVDVSESNYTCKRSWIGLNDPVLHTALVQQSPSGTLNTIISACCNKYKIPTTARPTDPPKPIPRLPLGTLVPSDPTKASPSPSPNRAPQTVNMPKFRSPGTSPRPRSISVPHTPSSRGASGELGLLGDRPC